MSTCKGFYSLQDWWDWDESKKNLFNRYPYRITKRSEHESTYLHIFGFNNFPLFLQNVRWTPWYDDHDHHNRHRRHHRHSTTIPFEVCLHLPFMWNSRFKGFLLMFTAHGGWMQWKIVVSVNIFRMGSERLVTHFFLHPAAARIK